MTIGIILIVAILVLGGVLATAGDRIGTKVGKARLSLFNLRPKKTATLITIVTGITISASTLGILFATSKPLRKGIFEYDQIQEKIREIRRELDRTIAERDRVKTEFEQARTQQNEAQKKLKAINQSLQFALGKLNQAVSDLDRKEEQLKNSQLQLSQTQAQKNTLQTEIQQRKAESQALLKQLQQGRVQIEQQNQKIQQKTAEIEQTNRNIQEKNRVIDLKNQQIEQANQTIEEKNQDIQKTNQLLAEKNKAINEKTEEIEEKNQVIAKQESQLEGLENQQTFLEREIQSLEQNFQELQIGTIVLKRGQVLASQVVENVNSQLAASNLEELLKQANQEALKLTQPGTNNSDQKMIQVIQTQLQEVTDEISNGEAYVVRIISAANYVLGEKQVQVFIDAALNRVIFQPGDVVAATSVDPKQMNSEQIRERIELLLAASSFRSRRMGVVSETSPIIANDNIQPLFQFFAQLRQQTQPVEIKAVASNVTYTAGPLVIELVAVRNGQILFQTCSQDTQLPSCQ